MWARLIEIFFACWMMISPFIFRHDPAEEFLWASDIACGGLVLIFALLSFIDRLEKAHLASLAVALWLVGVGFSSEIVPSPPAYQNSLIVGLLIGMIAIVPSQSHLPPRAWREFYTKKTER